MCIQCYAVDAMQLKCGFSMQFAQETDHKIQTDWFHSVNSWLKNELVGSTFIAIHLLGEVLMNKSYQAIFRNFCRTWPQMLSIELNEKERLLRAHPLKHASNTCNVFLTSGK